MGNTQSFSLTARGVKSDLEQVAALLSQWDGDGTITKKALPVIETDGWVRLYGKPHWESDNELVADGEWNRCSMETGRPFHWPAADSNTHRMYLLILPMNMIPLSEQCQEVAGLSRLHYATALYLKALRSSLL